MRVAIAEDVLLTRQGIAAVLQTGGHQIAWETDDASRILPYCVAELPDLLITDVRMPPNHQNDGLQAALTVRDQFPDLPILVLSQYPGNEYARKLLVDAPHGKAGTGYLLKESVGQVSQFLAVAEEVAGGGVRIDPKVVSILLMSESKPRLSAKQAQVLGLIAQGKTNHQIAAELYISAATLERVISGLFVDLGIAHFEGNRRVLAVLEYLRSPIGDSIFD